MKSFSSAAFVAMAASALVSAQTFTACNPLHKKCDPDPAFGNKVECDFTHGECPAFNTQGASLQHGDKGAVFTIKADGDSPTIHTGKYIFFGEVEVEVQAAPGRGIVTSVVLQSDDLDEIDWEWVGANNAQVQTNYFSKGDTTTYDRGATHNVANPIGQFHSYKIKWTPSAIVWSINGQPVRTLTYEAAKGGSTYPQTPMQVKLGSWVAGGAKSSPGTVEWAGGHTDFSQGPFLAYYKRITITDFAGKDSPANGDVRQYVYSDTDRSGSWKSIKVEHGQSKADSKREENGLSDGKDSGSSSHNEIKSVVDQNMSTASSFSSMASKPTSMSRPSNDTSDGPPVRGADRTISGSSSSSSGSSSDSGSPKSTMIPAAAASGLNAASYGSIFLAVAGALALQLLL
ncbi:hypothetical protein XA68_11653 [Ophiocordyceps unilateralis]|uniref:Crh-like protein n=1 Tax=Ophiocordyceps unilateralis TaxID=268505 RepID=A0A2A9PF68_OPHUN|nr:hypothetical protein XA68_11653 [Ophiocordyceps unilateralis]